MFSATTSLIMGLLAYDMFYSTKAPEYLPGDTPVSALIVPGKSIKICL